MSKQNKIGALIIVFFLILAKFYSDSVKGEKKKMINENTVYAIGSINDIYYDRFSQKLNYSFKVNNNSYSETISKNLGNSRSDWDKIKEQKWPIIYSKNDPSKSDILIKKNDFEKWKLSIPDSLMWICDSLHLCY